MSLFVDQDSVACAYEEVRNDSSETKWALLTYEGKQVGTPQTGVDYDEMLGLLGDDDRCYCYVRFEYDNRARFAFITWIGPSVSPLKKAKVSTDKAFVKQIFVEFGKEILADQKSDVNVEKVRKILEEASGAAYGTGK